MSEWLNLERLPGNDLILPSYKSGYAAGIDFSVCLTRPCKIIEGPTKEHRTEFYAGYDGERYSSRDFAEHGCTQVTADGIKEYGPPEFVMLEPNECIMASLGWKCEFGTAYVLQLHVRSSVGLRGLRLGNGMAIIDPDYRGELYVLLHNWSNWPIKIEHGDRLVQGVLMKLSQAIIQEKTVSSTDRGDKGFGSTGIK